MQVREERRGGIDVERRATPPGKRRAERRGVIVAIAAGAAIVASAAAILIGAAAGFGGGVTEPAVGDSAPGLSRLQEGIAWLRGLDAGLIVAPEIRSHLAAQDPELARRVTAAWAELERSRSVFRARSSRERGAWGPLVDPNVRMDQAIGWLHGLATGTILPSEVTAHLVEMDPTLAHVVMRVWTELAPVADRGSDWPSI